MPELRPMRTADAEVVLSVMDAAFNDLARRFGREPAPFAPGGPGLVRIRHLVGTDPAGAWVSVGSDGAVTGAALGLVREGLWGLSLLVVAPGLQSAGAGSALLRAALDPGRGLPAIILASEDHRALRAYARAGFALRPTFDALGAVSRPPARPPAVRAGRWPADRDLCDAAGRAVRGAAHGDDVGAMLAAGVRLLVHDGGGFATLRGHQVTLVAAPQERVARELLRAALAEFAGAGDVEVDFLDAGQAWAMEEVLDAGLDLRPAGAIAVRGEVGPLRPYIPSGSYL